MHFFASFSIEMLDTFKWSMIQLEKNIEKDDQILWTNSRWSRRCRDSDDY